ncbi:chemotaxis protein CheW [Thalassotalea euphylliae]|uniref:Chemotaxis protein CheW n=1 Tax=Thalassotalea euphylliae TaxID=1655234 RepID=A0A3E0TNG1_9GAMM|nr:chemotaxis protein CheW [Thalassotalea euphylliae]REL26096.1 chemotaxis protein CheW [Thalassotalea euphylliae]
MSKSLAASQKVMRSYLSELLTDDAESLEQAPSTQSVLTHKEPDSEKLEKLLENVAKPSLSVTDKVTSTRAQARAITADAKPVKSKVTQAPKAPAKPAAAQVKTDVPVKTTAISTTKSEQTVHVKPQKDYREGSFQAMFFDVAGLTIAVPLIELGGIHNVESINNLMGKPDWFKGVMLHREEKINVVDTALWVMPEKCDQQLMDSLHYQYIIMLSNSQWGLMAEQLVDTVTLEQSDVKWMDNNPKRPWLAGLVKERMCALLDIEALIKMLDQGLNVYPN